jgi:putative transposase
LHFLARVVGKPTDIPAVLEELRWVSERPMIIRMTTSRPQRRYDHRLRDLIQRTGDLTLATDLGVPRSTARGWLGAAPSVVVGLEVADLTEPELRQEILKLRRRVEKLAALLRLALALLHTSGFSLSRERLPEGEAKLRILSAVDRARECIPLRAVLRFLRLSPSRFQAWRRRQTACALDDQSSCPRTSPHRLTPSEVQAIGDMVTSPEYRHVPTGTLAVLAQRLGTVSASASTWYRLVRKYGWRRPRVRVHPAKPKVGLRTTGPNEMWHIDTTVIRLLDGTRAYLHAVIDNFSRRILAWRVADTFAPVNSVAVLLEASRGATRSASAPIVLADAGVENVNAEVDELIATGVLRRLLAFTELKFSNSMIEAWWRSLKHQWLFLHPLDTVATIRRLVAFYVHEHNHVLPHSAFRGQTPDEMYFGTGDAVPADLMSRAAAARRARVEANRSASCETCPSLNAAASPRLLTAVAIANSCASRRSPREPDRARPMRRGPRMSPESAHRSSIDRGLAELNGDNSRVEVPNVREESWVPRKALAMTLHYKVLRANDLTAPCRRRFPAKPSGW